MNTTSHDCGRPDPACLTADKWHLLNMLTQGADSFDIGHRTLGVLKALLTFLPGRKIAADRPAIVFPSNRTLSERLNGMPESTLRRHLATLVNSGLVNRRDSPNRKRFARRAQGLGIAFGFDLSPLAKAAHDLEAAAARAQTRAEHRAVLHARLLDLCHANDTHPMVANARKALRRRNNAGELEYFITALSTEDLSGTDSQIERHIQEADEKDSDIKDPPHFRDLKTACPTAQSFYPGELRTWDDAVRISRNIAPMMGIETAVVLDAENKMGQAQSATTILTMLERVASLHNPGGYLRRLTQLAGQGRYNAKISHNRQNCQLTT